MRPHLPDIEPKEFKHLAPSLYRQAALLDRHFPSSSFEKIYSIYPDHNRKRDGALFKVFRPIDPGITRTAWAHPPGYERGRLWDLGESRRYFLGVSERSANFGSFCEFSEGQWLVWPHDHEKTVAFLDSLRLLSDIS